MVESPGGRSHKRDREIQSSLPIKQRSIGQRSVRSDRADLLGPYLGAMRAVHLQKGVREISSREGKVRRMRRGTTRVEVG